MASDNLSQEGMGEDALPDDIRRSNVLSTANRLQLAAVPEMPVIDATYFDQRLQTIFQYYAISPDELEIELQLYAKELLQNNQVAAAWQVLLSIP